MDFEMVRVVVVVVVVVVIIIIIIIIITHRRKLKNYDVGVVSNADVS